MFIVDITLLHGLPVDQMITIYDGDSRTVTHMNDLMVLMDDRKTGSIIIWAQTARLFKYWSYQVSQIWFNFPFKFDLRCRPLN